MKKKRKKAGIHHRLLARINALFAFMLLLSYLAPYIPPSPLWPIGIMGLSYPIFLVINIFFLIFWAVLKKKYVLMPLVVVLAGWGHIGNHFRTLPAGVEDARESISIMSYNIQLSKNRYTPQEPVKAANWIAEVDPDILCFQEIYYAVENKNNRFLSALPNQLTPVVANRSAGLAILSHYPIIKQGFVSSQGAVFCIFADLLMDKDTLRVYNTQLASNYLDDEKTLFDQQSKLNDKEISEKASSIVRKLIAGFGLRVKEVNMLSAHIQNSPYPVILCGDFNNTPLSYTYHKLKGDKLKDSFKKQAKIGMGNTYNGNLPPIRIDYILHDNNYRTLTYQCHEKPYSDHFAITANIAKP